MSYETTSAQPVAVVDELWQEVQGQVISGHGIASGRAVHSPYPRGSLEMQAPHFKSAGIDLDHCFLGTINVSVAPGDFQFHSPAITVRGVNWTSVIEPEDFSFSPCELVVNDTVYTGWIYYPRPETKTVHFQPAHMVEIIMPFIEGLKVGAEVKFRFSSQEAQVINTEVTKVEAQATKEPAKQKAFGVGVKHTVLQCFGVCVLMLGILQFSGCTVSEITGSNLQKDPQKRVDVGIEAATEYLRANDVDNALRHLEKVLELEPKNAKAHQTMALVHTQEGNLDQAEVFYKKAIRYDETLSSARNNYATLLYSRGRYEEAVEQLQVASKDLSYDNRAQAVQNLGLCYIKLERLFDAEASFQTALRLNPQLPRSLLELSDILLQQNQHKLAARYLRDYSSMTRHSARSLWIGIQVERVNGDDNALSSYALALRNLYPKSPEFRRYMETKTNDR